MILGQKRDVVIENIRNAALARDFYAKVEPDDPVLTAQEGRQITDRYLKNRKSPWFRLKTALACGMTNVAAWAINRDTQIVGAEKLPKLYGGAIVTSNHFSPLENTVVRHMVKKKLKRKLSVVSQVTNFAMKGPVGFLMNYADTVPLSSDMYYMSHGFMDVLQEKVQKNVVLIYPEQEMWFHYRKPRPPKRGAYYFAAKLRVPVISCFVEILDKPEMENDRFHKTRYRIHILGVLEPEAGLSPKLSSQDLCDRDYALKKQAYEEIYGKPLTYDFAPEDIAGWTGDGAESL